MKKIILTLSAFSILFSACKKTSTEQANAVDSQEVEVTQNENTETFNQVSLESHLEWRASHLGGLGKRFGKASIKEAEFLVNNGKLTNAKATIDLTTISVDNFPNDADKTSKLTGHLKNKDFFNVEKYPTAVFVLTQIEEATGDYNSIVSGNLRILETTKNISFKANVNTTNGGLTFSSEDFTIDRTEWNLNYHEEGSKGLAADHLIDNKIGFTLNLSLTKS